MNNDAGNAAMDDMPHGVIDNYNVMGDRGNAMYSHAMNSGEAWTNGMEQSATDVTDNGTGRMGGNVVSVGTNYGTGNDRMNNDTNNTARNDMPRGVRNNNTMTSNRGNAIYNHAMSPGEAWANNGA